ncbi:MAG: SIS domain-containing protein [Promethearchaeota archaeon]
MGLENEKPEKKNNELGIKTLSEIWEIPKVLKSICGEKKNLEFIRGIAEDIFNRKELKSIYLFGSGTSYHAGLAATYWFSQLAKYPTHCELAPEFPYLIEPIIAKKHCSICVSQSGETELVVYAATKALEKDSFVIGITNNKGSQLAKVIGEERTILLHAGPELSVLATKTYVAELMNLLLLALNLAHLKKQITDEEYDSLISEAKAMPQLISLVLPQYKQEIKKIAPYFKFARNAFVIGAGPDYANCLEAALKLKEGARIFAQAFSTAEFPHGPITLAESHLAFVLCLIPHWQATSRYNDVIKLVDRLQQRGVTVLGIKDTDDFVRDLDMFIDIPTCTWIFRPILSIIPIQLLVVEIATIQGINCDTPKYLSKISRI